jgi:hypothetical protein
MISKDAEISNALFNQRKRRIAVKVRRRFKGKPNPIKENNMSIGIQAIGFYGAPILSDLDDFETWEYKNKKQSKNFGVKFQGMGTDWQQRTILIEESLVTLDRDSNNRLEPLNTDVFTSAWQVRIHDFAYAAGLEVGPCQWYVGLNEY